MYPYMQQGARSEHAQQRSILRPSLVLLQAEIRAGREIVRACVGGGKRGGGVAWVGVFGDKESERVRGGANAYSICIYNVPMQYAC